MKKNEKTLQAQLAKALRQAMPGSVVFRHEDVMTAGIPDISVTWHGRTFWLELKAFGGKTRGIQALTIGRLGRVGYSGMIKFGASGQIWMMLSQNDKPAENYVFLYLSELVQAIVEAMRR